MMETLVFNQVSSLLLQDKFLCNSQTLKAASRSCVLVLLDYTADFETLNYQILLSTHFLMCITGTTFHWCEYYLTGTSFRASQKGEMSKSY